MKRKLKGVCVSEAQGKVETIPYTKRKHFIVVPYMFERKIGVYVFQKLKGNFKKKVLQKIHPESKVAISWLVCIWRGLKWEVLVVKKDEVNAYYLPCGKIFMFTGLLEHFTTDEEIATIIGHEACVFKVLIAIYIHN
ncbi:putative peptidase M48 [Helianthus annuus]|nr:putative peptidase M48 [Helianthus annuus]